MNVRIVIKIGINRNGNGLAFHGFGAGLGDAAQLCRICVVGRNCKQGVIDRDFGRISAQNFHPFVPDTDLPLEGGISHQGSFAGKGKIFVQTDFSMGNGISFRVKHKILGLIYQ